MDNDDFLIPCGNCPYQDTYKEYIDCHLAFEGDVCTWYAEHGFDEGGCASDYPSCDEEYCPLSYRSKLVK